VASQPRNSAREERRLEIRRLLIASVSSAAAAVIVSQFWVSGTWLAAALTPVFVILIQEALHRPVDVVADRFTANRTAVLPQATGAGPPPRGSEAHEAEPMAPEQRPSRAQPPVRVYRTGEGKAGRPRTARRRLAIGTIAVTAFLAFAIAAFAITGTELITGSSIGKGSHKTTLFGGERNTSTTETAPTGTSAQPQQQQQQKTTPTTTQQQDTQQKTTQSQPSGTTPQGQTTSP
jgi:hypothetical protein